MKKNLAKRSNYQQLKGMDIERIPANVIAEMTIVEEEPVKQAKEIQPEKLRIMKNLTIICLSFFLLFMPFESLANLQSTMNVEQNIGMISQAIIYASNILSCILFPKLIIKKIGFKYAFVLSILCFSPFFAANFYLHMGTFYPSAIVLGMGSGILWSVVGAYINEIGELYAAHETKTVDAITSRFFGIFFFVFQSTQIWGNLISFYILKPYEASYNNNSFTFDTADVLSIKSLDKLGNVSCGANFCGGMNENLLPPSDFKRYVLIAVYLCFALISALVVFLFMDPLKQNEAKSGDDNVSSRIVATLNHLKNADQRLIVPLSIFGGLEGSFIFADYSQAIVACSWGLHNVSLVFVCFGVVSAIMSFLSGRLIQCVPRVAIMIAAAICNTGVCIVLLLWQPKSEEFIYFFILVGIWGLCDGIWLTQISAFYGVLFKQEQEAAFANLRLWESVGYGLGFGYSSFLCMYQKIHILLAFLIVGLTGYIVIEIKSCIRKIHEMSTSHQT